MADMKRTTGAAILYTLADPRTGEVRYVGWTSQRPRGRFSRHLYDARRGDNSHRCRWIRTLVADGCKPLMRPVAILAVEEAPSTEIRYIAAMRKGGARLVNTTNGGDGALGYVPTAEARAKIGAASRGRVLSEEARARIGDAAHKRPRSHEEIEKVASFHRGRKRSPETCARISAALKGKKAPPFTKHHREALASARRGKHHSPEAKAKIGKSSRERKRSPEARAKTSLTLRGVKKSAETRSRMSAAQYARWARKKSEAA